MEQVKVYWNEQNYEDAKNWIENGERLPSQMFFDIHTGEIWAENNWSNNEHKTYRAPYILNIGNLETDPETGEIADTRAGVIKAVQTIVNTGATAEYIREITAEGGVHGLIYEQERKQQPKEQPNPFKFPPEVREAVEKQQQPTGRTISNDLTR